ncbi:MAG TPA: NUDIX hydrolase [Acidobacteriaceae bacterium]|nr:NUDIX hydrolase [Acidobacteriaceae bacterium]
MTRVQRVVISLLMRSDAGILLLLRGRPYAEFPTGGGVGVGLWELPGGGLNFGEAALAAGVREAREETGILLDERTLRLTSCCDYLLETAECRSHRIHVVYEARLSAPPPVRHSDEHSAHEWIRDPNELRRLPMVEEIRAVVAERLGG